MLFLVACVEKPADTRDTGTIDTDTTDTGGVTDSDPAESAPADSAPDTDPADSAPVDSAPDTAADADGDGAPWPEDCDDADATVFPGAGEACDGRDEDCDGRVDEMVAGGTHASVQAAIDAACAAGDTVWVAAGTWTENVVFRGVDLVLQGEAGAILDGAACTRGAADCATVAVEGGEVVELVGLTITGGLGSTVEPMASSGGGVWVYASSATLRDCVLEDNVVAYTGGGAGVYGGTLTLDGVTATRNVAERGGGVGLISAGASLVASDSAFTDNTATGYGGGVFARWETSFAIADSSLTGNLAASGAGLESWESGSLERNTISANIATSFGGGVACGEGVITGADNVVSASVPDDVWSSGGCWQAGDW